MLKFGLDFEKAIEIIFSVNGNLDEAEHFVKHGVLTDGMILALRLYREVFN